MKDYSIFKKSEVKEEIDLFGTFYVIVYDEVNKRLLTHDRCGRNIEIIQLADGIVKLDAPKKLSDYGAITMALSKTNEIYISCYLNNAIIVFDERLSVLRRFDLLDVKYYEKMVLNDDASEVYLVSYEMNKVSRYNTRNGSLIYEYLMIKPWDIAFKNNRLFIINMKEKHIQVIDTSTNLTLKNIFVDNWRDLDAIYVDNDSNVFVCANDGTSSKKHLFIFNRNYDLINKITLGEYYYVTGIVIVSDNLFLLSDESNLQFVLHQIALK